MAGWHAQAAFAWACSPMSGVHAHAKSGVGMPPGYPEQHAKHVRERCSSPYRRRLNVGERMAFAIV
jgi:hypothetical protein